MNNADHTDINLNTCIPTPKHTLPSSPSSSRPSPRVLPSSIPPVSPKHARKKDKTVISSKSDQLSKQPRTNRPSNSLIPKSRSSPSPDRPRSFPRSQNGRVTKASDVSTRTTRSTMAAAHAAVAAAAASSSSAPIPTVKPSSAPVCNNVVNQNYTSASNIIPSHNTSKPETSSELTKNCQSLQKQQQHLTTTSTAKIYSSSNAATPITCALSSSHVVTTAITPSITTPEPTKLQCSSCEKLAVENEFLHRRVARLIYRVQTAAEMQRTHGQRILRAYYEQKVLAMDGEHRRTCSAMLNRQKMFLETEMKNLEFESRSREAALNTQVQEERGKLASMASVMSAMQREKESVVERTEEAIRALQRNLSQVQARTTRLEQEKTSLEVQLAEKRVLVDTLAAAASVHGHEVQREDLVAQLSEDERVCKDKVIVALNAEIKGLRHRLNAEMEINAQLVHSIKTVEEKRRDDRAKHEESLGQCKAGFQKDADRLGRLIASVIQEFANAPSEASTRSGSNESTGGGREDSGQAGSIGTDGD